MLFAGPAILSSLWIVAGLVVGYEMVDMFKDMK